MHIFIIICAMLYTYVNATQLYPSNGVTAFEAYSQVGCPDGKRYRGRLFQMIAPKLEQCYKCGGKAIKYENLFSSPTTDGVVRQCVNLNNDCFGSFSCTNLNTGSCVSHPCISGAPVFGKWINQLDQGFHVQPYEDLFCTDFGYLPMPYYYTNMGGECRVFDNTTSIVPNNPKCRTWSSAGNDKTATVCTALEVSCDALTTGNDPEECDINKSGVDCVVANVGGECGSGTTWPLLGTPGFKFEFIDGALAYGSDSGGACNAMTHAMAYVALILYICTL